MRQPPKKTWTRRRFLGTGLAGSVVMGSGSLPVLGATATAPGFAPHQLQVLRAAMDEIIPAADGMPAASAVGGLEYLDRLARRAEFKKQFEGILAALGEASRRRFGKSFLALPGAERVAALAELEKKAAPESFRTLRDYVYEAYYTQPQVWKLLGYESHLTNQGGPRMKPFDEAILAKVRKMRKLYREVG